MIQSALAWGNLKSCTLHPQSASAPGHGERGAAAADAAAECWHMRHPCLTPGSGRKFLACSCSAQSIVSRPSNRLPSCSVLVPLSPHGLSAGTSSALPPWRALKRGKQSSAKPICSSALLRRLGSFGEAWLALHLALYHA